MKLNADLLQKILLYKGVKSTHVLGVAVSGGKDSMVLLHLLSKLDFKLKILHVNYGLRGKESDDDELFIRSVATSLKFDCKVFNAKKQIDTKSGIQEKAREIRYHWFQELYVKGEINWLLTAHHSQDVAETVLLNLFRKTGLKGLSGIADRGFILRPLVEFSTKEILEYANTHQIQWREDSSNAKLDYSRNVIRHNIMPKISKEFPLAISNIRETTLHLKEELRLKESFIEYFRPLFLILDNKHLIILDLSSLQAFSEKELLLFELIKGFGFNRNQAAEILHSLNNNIKGGIWSNEVFEACLSDERLFIKRRERLIKLNSIELKKLDFNKAIYTPFFECKLNSKPLPGYENLSIPKDFEKITIRFWQDSDRIKIKSGSKKVSDVFNEFGLPLILRKNYPILIVDNEIIWIPGIRKTTDYKVISKPLVFINIKTILSQSFKKNEI